MTLREQASALLTTYYGGLATAQILDKLQPLFDQMAREREALAERFGVELSSDGETWFSVCDDGEREHDTFAEAVIATLGYVENDLKLAETTQHEARTEAHQLRRERDDLRAKLTQAEAALKGYGRHDSLCSGWRSAGFSGGVMMNDLRNCDCGLGAALAALDRG